VWRITTHSHSGLLIVQHLHTRADAVLREDGDGDGDGTVDALAWGGFESCLFILMQVWERHGRWHLESVCGVTQEWTPS